MSILIRDLFRDHIESLILPSLMIGSFTATDSQWFNVVRLMSSKYRFSVDRDTFAMDMCEMIPLPQSSSGIAIRGVYLYYVHHTGLHHQDAAVYEMLKVANKSEKVFYGSRYSEIEHRLPKPKSVERIRQCVISIPEHLIDTEFTDKWKLLFNYRQRPHTINSYLDLVETL